MLEQIEPAALQELKMNSRTYTWDFNFVVKLASLIGHGADSLICEPCSCNSYFEGLQILKRAKTLICYLTICDRVYFRSRHTNLF